MNENIVFFSRGLFVMDLIHFSHLILPSLKWLLYLGHYVTSPSPILTPRLLSGGTPPPGSIVSLLV